MDGVLLDIPFFYKEASFLVSYWFIFWNKFLTNPYLLCTSEIASTYFPHWLWMGRKWQAKDDIYYKEPASIPFLSMWYWPNVLVSKLTNFLIIDSSMRLYAYFIISHYLLASLIAYKVMGLFGAITLTYAGYCIKPQTPSFVYTMCWMPGMLLDGWMGPFSCFMAITGGYWPIFVYFMPFAAIVNPLCLIGIIPALCQIIPFLKYWPKSVRSEMKIDRNIGKLHWSDLKYLFIPRRSTGLINGVHYPETEMYMGIAVLFIWQASWWWITAVYSIFVLCSFLNPIQRIPARALYLLTFSLVYLSNNNYASPVLILLQVLLLLRNSSIYPSFPFSQWWDKPSKLYSSHPYNGVWPNCTGYLNEQRISSYKGAFALR